MELNSVTRRDFVRLIGLGSGATLLVACNSRTSTVTSGPLTSSASPDSFGEANLEIALRAKEGQVQIFPGSPTDVWHYEAELIKGPSNTIQKIPDSYLGPIIRAVRGDRVRVHFTNELREETIVHWHGLHVSPEADGHPRLAIQPGETYTYEFTVKDRAGTYWFHPHPHGRTGPQVYFGLAGIFIVSDEEERNLALPAAKNDIPLVIQDRSFNENNQLTYGGTGMMTQMVGFLGNQILINGQSNFSLSLANQSYRLRLINGSNSRIYKLAWDDGSPLTVIGTDGGLLEKPVEKNYVTLAPAQRIELWVDLTKHSVGDVIKLIHLPADVPGGASSFSVIEINVNHSESSSIPLPKKLARLELRDIAEATNLRTPRSYSFSFGMGMRWTINGRSFEMTGVAQDEIVKLNELEVWKFDNQLSNSGMGMMNESLPHPIHIHGLQFQVIEREVTKAGRPAWESLSDGFVDEGWHDTVLVMPGETVKVLLKFEDYAGLYLYHCHNLEHEDMGMMRNFRIEV